MAVGVGPEPDAGVRILLKGGPVTVVEASAADRAAPAVLTVVLTVVAAVLFAVGWVVGALSVPLGWAWAAVRVGWSDARQRGGIGR